MISLNYIDNSKLYKQLLIIIIVLAACSENKKSQPTKINRITKTAFHHTIISTDSTVIKYEKILQNAGFINITDIDSSIIIDLQYASTHNFMNCDMYHGFKKCYVHPSAAQKLISAQMFLKSKEPKFSLIVFDATRPAAVQQFMWDSAKMNICDKRKFLANPKKTSLHNYGLAVDCSLIDDEGNLLDMGTEYDFAGEKAYPCRENELFTNGELTEKQIKNRQLLRTIMLKAGFTSNPYEWWHFNSCTILSAIKKYPRIVDFNTFVTAETDTVN